ncbi:hypothetical protein NBRC116593_14380 [Sulfitobacter pacificus]
MWLTVPPRETILEKVSRQTPCLIPAMSESPLSPTWNQSAQKHRTDAANRQLHQIRHESLCDKIRLGQGLGAMRNGGIVARVLRPVP